MCFTQTLAPGDFKKNDNDEKESEMKDTYHDEQVKAPIDKVIYLPKPAVQCCNDDYNTIKLREVADSCAICLSSYEEGDIVCWSSNATCPHVFHHGCIAGWIRRRNTSSCPVCRQEFVNIKND